MGSAVAASESPANGSSERSVVLSVVTATPWEAIADWIPHVVCVTDAEGSTESFNRRGHDLRVDTGRHVRLGVAAGVHPGHAGRARVAWESAIGDSIPYRMEYRVSTGNGDYRWMVELGLPVLGPEGHVIRWAGPWTDVDDLKRLHDYLGGGHGETAASLALLEALRATAPVAIGVVDRELRIVHMNELQARLNGLSPDEARAGACPR
jgi:PAS domain-containing protein